VADPNSEREQKKRGLMDGIRVQRKQIAIYGAMLSIFGLILTQVSVRIRGFPIPQSLPFGVAIIVIGLAIVVLASVSGRPTKGNSEKSELKPP
jgi:hypothetical protein